MLLRVSDKKFYKRAFLNSVKEMVFVGLKTEQTILNYIELG